MSKSSSVTKRLTAGLAFAAAALLASACGSSSTPSTPPAAGGGSTTSAPTTTAAPTTTSTTAPAVPTAQKDAKLAGEVPSAIKSKGTITVAADATYAPDEFIAADGHTVVGMDADLSTAIGQVLGLKVNMVNATFDTIIPGLTDGKYDMGASSFTDTLARQKQVDFVTYFTAGEAFYTSKGSSIKITSLGSICGLSVAVETGTTEESDAKTQSTKCTSKGQKAVKVLSFANQNSANLAVSSGRAQAGFLDSQIAAYVVAQSNGQFALNGPTVNSAPYGLALPKGNGMAAPVLGAVKSLMASGIYLDILKKWGVESGAITNPAINGATS
jgi:polar amino acid transport system substrate-binding protein